MRRLPTDALYSSQRYIAALAAPLALMAGFSLFSPPEGHRSRLFLSRPSANTPFRDATRNITAEDAPALKVEGEIITQKYCSNNNTSYDLVFKLRMRFINQSDKKVMVAKNIGHGDYQILIANNAKNLSAGKYEFETNYDWADPHVLPEPREQFDSPGSDFAILAPGDSLQAASEFLAAGAANLNGSNHNRGTLDPGNHVLAVEIATWRYLANPVDIQKRWQNFGNLIYNEVSVKALPFSLPRSPKVENCSVASAISQRRVKIISQGQEITILHERGHVLELFR
jgi:hypothetical protein